MDKVCSKCGERKSLDGFWRDKRGKFGRHSTCTACVTKYHQQPERKRANAECQRLRWVRLEVRQAQAERRQRPEVKQANVECQRKRRQRPEVKQAKREIERERRAFDPQFRLVRLLRDRIRKVLNGTSKSASTEALLGCTFAEFRVIWDHLVIVYGYGPDDGLHVDHLTPCAAFDLTDPEHQAICFHYSNLRPMRAVENMSKGATRPTDAELTDHLMRSI
jgi:hypothetical protein